MASLSKRLGAMIIIVTKFRILTWTVRLQAQHEARKHCGSTISKTPLETPLQSVDGVVSNLKQDKQMQAPTKMARSATGL